MCYSGFLLRDLILSYYHKETTLFTIDPHYGTEVKPLTKNPVLAYSQHPAPNEAPSAFFGRF